MAVYKFKSEILDRHGMNMEESDFGLVSSLAGLYPNAVSLVGPSEEIGGFRSHGLKTEELACTRVAPVIERTLAAVRRGDAVVIAKADLLQDDLYGGGLE